MKLKFGKWKSIARKMKQKDTLNTSLVLVLLDLTDINLPCEIAKTFSMFQKCSPFLCIVHCRLVTITDRAILVSKAQFEQQCHIVCLPGGVVTFAMDSTAPGCWEGMGINTLTTLFPLSLSGAAHWPKSTESYMHEKLQQTEWRRWRERHHDKKTADTNYIFYYKVTAKCLGIKGISC